VSEPASGSPSEQSGQIVALVDDLLVSSRIDAAARASGREVRYVRSAEDFWSAVGEARPAAVLVGMAATRLPWAKLIGELRRDPSTRSTYVLAFGPHKDLELRRRALEAGVDRVVANSTFAAALPKLLSQPTAEVDEE
jgi:PleD family two-component response regulator